MVFFSSWYFSSVLDLTYDLTGSSRFKDWALLVPCCKLGRTVRDYDRDRFGIGPGGLPWRGSSNRGSGKRLGSGETRFIPGSAFPRESGIFFHRSRSSFHTYQLVHFHARRFVRIEYHLHLIVYFDRVVDRFVIVGLQLEWERKEVVLLFYLLHLVLFR